MPLKLPMWGITLMPPKTPSRLFHWLTKPSQSPLEPGECLAELEGIAFLRRWAGCPNQEAWDTCEEPFIMFQAVATTNNPNAARLLGHAVLTYRDAVTGTLADVDPMEYPDAKLYCGYLASIQAGTQIGATALMVMKAHQILAPENVASQAMCRWLRVYLPAAPFAFEGFEGVEHDNLLSHLARCDLDQGERRWVEGLIARLQMTGTLNKNQRAKVETLLRLHMGWDFDHATGGA